MDILLAKPRGFCAGVNRAIALVRSALAEFGAPVYVLHEIVHNTHVLNELEQMGAVFVEELEEIPEGARVIFSAHGVARAVEDQASAMHLRTIDATCPLVAKVHRRISRLHAQGCALLVLGHKGHPEVEGTCGQVSGPVHVVSTPEEVAALPFPVSAKVGYVTQTTLSVDDTRELLAAIRARFPRIEEPDRTDICYATTNRQQAVRQLAKQCDIVLIVGSKNSSNSNRLREVAAGLDIPAYLIDHADEIQPDWLQGKKRAGVSAGASAPEHLVTGVIARLQAISPGKVEELNGEDEGIHFPVVRQEKKRSQPG